MLCALAIVAVPAAGNAQPQPAPVSQPAPASLPLPDVRTLAKLVWSTMAAVDHANRTGNYSVLRDLGTPEFQAGNDSGRLAAAFAGLRQQGLDLADTLLYEPWYEFPPAFQGPLLRLRGGFRMRPTGVQFDLLYRWDGRWRLEGIALRSAPMSDIPQPAGR